MGEERLLGALTALLTENVSSGGWGLRAPIKAEQSLPADIEKLLSKLWRAWLASCGVFGVLG